MRDVAALAGVGVMTVSRVVNGRGGVGPERAARVWQAIEELDYRHNVTARNLRLTGQPTATIGVLLQDVAEPALGRAAARGREGGRRAQLPGAVRQLGRQPGAGESAAGGLLHPAGGRADHLPSAPDHRYLLPEVRRGIQVVFTGRPAPTVAADTVLSDNVGGARSAVAHLIAHGHTRIGFLGRPGPGQPHRRGTLPRVRGRAAGRRPGGRRVARPARRRLRAVGPAGRPRAARLPPPPPRPSSPRSTC